MATSSFNYPNASREVLYSVALRAAVWQALMLKSADREGGVIHCESPRTLKTYGQQIELTVASDGLGSSLTITTHAGQLFDWGEGKGLIRNLKDAIDNHFSGLQRLAVLDPCPVCCHTSAASPASNAAS